MYEKYKYGWEEPLVYLGKSSHTEEKLWDCKWWQQEKGWQQLKPEEAED